MNGCVNPTRSTTRRWLAAANRLFSTSNSIPPPSAHKADATEILSLLSRWKPASLLGRQTLGQTPHPPAISSTAKQTYASAITIPEASPQVSETILYKLIPTAPHEELAAVATTDHASLTTVQKRPTLPISPLMDPDIIAAKERHHTRKLRPSKSPELFQQILNKNPYAQALATPLRRCQLTKSALPSFFLQDFNLMAHPAESGGLWYVPRSLTTKKAPKLSAGEIGLASDNDTDLESKDDANSCSQSKQTSEPASPTFGHSVFTLAYQSALRAMQDPKGYKRKQGRKRSYKAKREGLMTAKDAPPARFIPDRFGQSRSAFKFLSTARWRSDMHEFVLELMRRRLVESLVWLTSLKRGYLVGCSEWKDALAKPQVGAFIWTGGEGEQDEGGDIPPEFATLDVSAGPQGGNRTKKIPVHNLRRLLGVEKLAELRVRISSGIFGRDIVVLKHKQVVLDVEMRLWKLQGYLAEYRDLYRDLEERPEQDPEDEDEDEDDYGNGFEDDEDTRE